MEYDPMVETYAELLEVMITEGMQEAGHIKKNMAVHYDLHFSCVMPPDDISDTCFIMMKCDALFTLATDGITREFTIARRLELPSAKNLDVYSGSDVVEFAEKVSDNIMKDVISESNKAIKRELDNED